MNKARLEAHKRRQAETAAYVRAKNETAMREWLEVWSDVDRDDPAVLDAHAEFVSERAIRLINAGRVLEGERREGALKRAGRFVREARSLERRAAALRAGEKPLDEWARCRCGAAFQPGERGYTLCWTCSSKDWYATSFACIFCNKRHSMSYPLCFACKQDLGRIAKENGARDTAEDDARFTRLMINRRDNYTCQMCGLDAMADGVELQVDHINPDGGNWPWNLQTLCGTCQVTKGKNYEKLDEREYWNLVQAYSTYLWDYLGPEEREALYELEPDWISEQIDFAAPQSWQTEDEVEEREGLLNVIGILGAVIV